MNFVKSICEICIHTSYCGVDENDEECYFEDCLEVIECHLEVEYRVNAVIKEEK
jgi:hypothetical protein